MRKVVEGRHAAGRRPLFRQRGKQDVHSGREVSGQMVVQHTGQVTSAVEQFERLEPAQSVAFESAAIEAAVHSGDLGREAADDRRSKLVLQWFSHACRRIHGRVHPGAASTRAAPRRGPGAGRVSR
ncbi:MAG: hypothetical protein ABL961_03465 [Vicinamibacterales bacterium]